MARDLDPMLKHFHMLGLESQLELSGGNHAAIRLGPATMKGSVLGAPKRRFREGGNILRRVKGRRGPEPGAF
jgi:hypothetical protein